MLVIGLIILVVLTLLGVQGMRTNVAQERMAGNMRERNLAFQAAEAALRAGEAQNPVGLNFQPLPNPMAAPADPDAATNPVAWNSGVAAPADGIGVVNAFDSSLDANPVFHMGPPEYIRVGLTLPPEFRLIYPVTSRGVGAQASSVVILQSGFEPLNN
ncbi:MAG: PilX N-terminal domain-containing pilus assembly protein [Burkholderiaceae bacterium]